MSADSMISAATVTHAGVLHTCKYGFANFGIWLLAVTFCYWCWCAWSLADQLNSLLGNTVTNQPAFLATRWPIDNLLPLTLFSGTGGWRRGGWTRFSWMLPCLLLRARSPNFLKCVSDTIRVIRYTLTCWTRRGQWQEQGKWEWGQDRPRPMPVCHHYYYCLLFLILESIRT